MLAVKAKRASRGSKAASGRRCHPEGRSEAEDRRSRLTTTGRCGPRKMCASRGRQQGPTRNDNPTASTCRRLRRQFWMVRQPKGRGADKGVNLPGQEVLGQRAQFLVEAQRDDPMDRGKKRSGEETPLGG